MSDTLGRSFLLIRTLPVIGLFLCLCLLSMVSQATSILYENFESCTATNWHGWTADNGVWDIGIPTSGPNSAHEGKQCAATVLDGGYPAYRSSRFISPAMTLPTLTSTQQITLKAWQWFSYAGGDYYDGRGCYGHIQVSEWSGTSWGNWTEASNTYSGGSSGWQYIGTNFSPIDLTSHAGKRIRVAFAHESFRNSADGWYLDEVRVDVTAKTPDLPLNQTVTFEPFTTTDWQGWSADNGVWEVGTPTSGPGAAHEGKQCAATILDDNYPTYRSSRFISPPVTLPTLTSAQQITVKAWQWFSYAGGDYYDSRTGYGHIQVSVWNGTGWDDWTEASNTYSGGSSGWQYLGTNFAPIDLTSYAGKRIRVAFAHEAFRNAAPGWYLDEIRVDVMAKTPDLPLNQTVTFEPFTTSDWQGWSADNGVWEVGTPTSGPGAAHEGKQCVATILDGNYPTYRSSRLISPPVTLPALTPKQQITLKGWQWFSYAGGDYYDSRGGYGHIQVSVWNGTGWDDWTEASSGYAGGSSGWQYLGTNFAPIDLSSYAGKRIRLAFAHEAFRNAAPGWYLDEIRVDVAANPPDLSLNHAVTFEPFTATDWQGWFADNGVWEVGTPTSGPGAAHEGKQCVATILDGNYPAYRSSRLISPPVTLPELASTQQLSLMAWQWFSYAGGDYYDGRGCYGHVQVSEWNGTAWGDWSETNNSFSGDSGGWKYIGTNFSPIDLSSYAGKRIRLGFMHEAFRNTAPGWYIDEVSLISPQVKLAFGQQPTNTVAGKAITPPMTVLVQDQDGNTVTDATNAVTLGIGTNPGGGKLSGTLTVNAVAGVATFSGLSIDRLGIGYTLNATATGLTSVISKAFNITPGPPAKLIFSGQPSNTNAGQAMTPAVKVQLLDSAGNLSTSASNAVTITIGANPANGTLSGTRTVNAINGVATFADLTINRIGTAYTFTASATGLAGTTSSAFNITLGPPAKLAFITQPSNTAAGKSITPAVTVQVQDVCGNLESSATNTVSIALGAGGALSGKPNAKAGGGTLNGTLSAQAVGGVATFQNLALNMVGTGYTFIATANGLATATSTAFTITPGPAAKLAFATQPSTAVAGQPITPAVTVVVQDTYGNVVTAATNVVTLAIGNNPANGILNGTLTASAVGGIATFSGLAIKQAGTGYTLTAMATGLTGTASNAFNITAGVPAKLAFGVQPSNTAAAQPITPAVTVLIQDSYSNLVTSATNAVTIALGANPGSGILSGTLTVNAVNGVATFADLSIDKIGSGYTLVASATGLTAVTSNPFDITLGPPAKLLFLTQPSNAVAGQSITPAVQVQILDTGGNQDTVATSTVTLAIGANPGSGTVGGTLTVNAISGVATFSGLSIDKPGTGYTLTAKSTGLTGATSASFNITPLAKLAFGVQPSHTVIGNKIAAVTVKVLDSFGNLVTTPNYAVTLALTANPGGGTLSGTRSVTTVNGVATFTDLSLNKLGNGYTLTASSTGLTGTTSNPFNIIVGPAAKFALVTQPTNTVAGMPISPAVTVKVLDANGNPVLTATNAVTIAIGKNPNGGILSGTLTVNAVNGIATFAGLSINAAGTGYTLTVTAPNLTGAVSAAFNITPGPAAKLLFGTPPITAMAGMAITPPVTVQVQDAYGNVVNATTTAVTLAIGANPSSGTLSGILTVNAVNGVATFPALSINKAGTGYTLTATATGVTGATSTAFNLIPGPPAKLLFGMQPSTTVAGQSITPAVTVQVLDAFSNLVNTATNAIIIGNQTVKAVNGMATFTNLTFNKAATGYTITASSPGLISVTSAKFNITAALATKLAFGIQPTTTVAGTAISPAVTVLVQDAFGNTVATATAVTLAIGTNPSVGVLSGTRTVNAVNGVATFANLSIDKAGMGYTLIAAATGLTPATSAPFKVTTPLTGVTITASPASPQPVKTNITFTAIPVGGSTVEYQFWLYNATTFTWSQLQAYSTNASCSWTPPSAGSYLLVVMAREQGTTQEVDGMLRYTVK